MIDVISRRRGVFTFGNHSSIDPSEESTLKMGVPLRVSLNGPQALQEEGA